MSRSRIPCVCGRRILPENWDNHLLRQDKRPHEIVAQWITDMADHVRHAGVTSSDYWRGFNDGIDRMVAELVKL